MMKRIVSVFLSMLLLYSVADAGGFRKRIRQIRTQISQLQQRVQEIEEIIAFMSGTIIPADLEVDMDGEDPTDPGDIKIVKGTVLVLEDCEGGGVTGWSKVSGPGTVNFVNVSYTSYEGAKGIEVNVTASGTYTIKLAFTGTDFSTYNLLSFWLKRSSHTAVSDVKMSIVDDGGTRGPDAATSLSSTLWVNRAFDLAAYTAAQRDVVTEVHITFTCTLTSPYVTVFVLDYLIADPGPSQIKGFDGERVVLIYPKCYKGSYTGNGTSQTITIPRKGTPSRIDIFSLASHPIVHWVSGMGDDSIRYDGTSYGATGITSVADCSFDVGSAAAVNTNNDVYYFTVFWED